MIITFAGMQVLYLEGDPSGRRFVSGTLTRLGVAHQVVRPGTPLPRDLSRYQAVILSGFSHHHLQRLEDLLLTAATQGGLGVLTIGGCRSYGRGGYAGSRLGALLPVTIVDGDDRVNVPSGMMIEPVGRHPISRGIDWTRSVVITGHNRVQAQPATTTVIAGRAIECYPDGIRLGASRVPLLVVREGQATGGRTASLATDLAPPWSGGLTDWGQRRLSIGEDEEVGDDYATLVINLVRWVAGEDTIRRPLPPWDELTELPTLEQPSLRVRRGGD